MTGGSCCLAIRCCSRTHRGVNHRVSVLLDARSLETPSITRPICGYREAPWVQAGIMASCKIRMWHAAVTDDADHPFIHVPDSQRRR